MDKPKISVILPVFNGMPYLPQAIESILKQSFPYFELIVIDDGSVDDTPQYLKRVSDSRIKIHRFEENVGSHIASNYAIDIAQCDLIARMDSDDIAMPERLAEQYAYMQKETDCIVLGSQVDEIDMCGKVVRERKHPLSDEAIRWQMAFGCPLLNPTLMYRRKEAIGCAGYYLRENLGGDYYLLTKLAHYGRLANLPQKLLQYRVHSNSMTAKKSDLEISSVSQISACYASEISEEFDAEAVKGLYMFLCSGQLPQKVSFEILVIFFKKWSKLFQGQRTQPSSDLNEWMGHIERRLRWRCLEQAQQNLYKPFSAWRWLRLAGKFDPYHGTFQSIIGRSFQKLLLKLFHAYS